MVSEDSNISTFLLGYLLLICSRENIPPKDLVNLGSTVLNSHVAR